jgi:hypothetical protein
MFWSSPATDPQRSQRVRYSVDVELQWRAADII